MTLAIGLLLSSGFPVPARFLVSFLDLYSRLLTGQSPFTAVKLIRSEGFPVDAARNDVVREMLKSDSDYLLFLDADMTFPADLPARLVAHRKHVVTARYHMRKPPFRCVGMVEHPLAGPGEFKAVDFGAGLVQIDRGGAGALLIHREVLEAIGDNWFRYQRAVQPPHEMTVSEDFWFYEQAHNVGYSTYMDWDTVCGHLAPIEINDATVHGVNAAARADFERRSPDEQRQILDHMVVVNRPHPWTGEVAAAAPRKGNELVTFPTGVRH